MNLHQNDWPIVPFSRQCAYEVKDLQYTLCKFRCYRCSTIATHFFVCLFACFFAWIIQTVQPNYSKVECDINEKSNIESVPTVPTETWLSWLVTYEMISIWNLMCLSRARVSKISQKGPVCM